MPDQPATTKDKTEEIPKLTQHEEELLKTAAARGSFVREFELQGRTYTVGTASGAANRQWVKEKAKARIRMRKELVDEMRTEEKLKEDADFPFFISEEDVSAAVVPDNNTSYVAMHLRTVDGEALTYEAAKATAEGAEGVIKNLLIDEIETTYHIYKDMLNKLRYSVNAKKSQAPASSSTNS